MKTTHTLKMHFAGEHGPLRFFDPVIDHSIQPIVAAKIGLEKENNPRDVVITVTYEHDNP